MCPIETTTAKRIRIRCHRRKSRYNTLESAIKAQASAGCPANTEIFECFLGDRQHWHIGRNAHPNARAPKDFRGSRQFCKSVPRIMWRRESPDNSLGAISSSVSSVQ